MSSRVDRLAKLAVGVGANVQPGQDVVVLAFDVEQAPVARAVADAAYRRGARFVSVLYWDQHVRRSRVARAPADSLGFVPDWWEAMLAECVQRRSAFVVVWGDPSRALLDDVESERVASDHMPFTASFWAAVGRGDLSWAFIPGPCPGLAKAILGEPDLDRLWEPLTPMLRLDAEDPERAWGEHVAMLQQRVDALERRSFLALRFRGGGTDLTVGLLRGACWMSVGGMKTSWGTPMVVNLPSEEVFTTPDYRRTEGVVCVTRPINLIGGGQVEELMIRFEQGRAVRVEAARGAELVRAQMAVDAARLAWARSRSSMVPPPSARPAWCSATS